MPSRQSLAAQERRKKLLDEIVETRYQLLEGISPDLRAEGDSLFGIERVRWLLSEMLCYYERESKPPWWDYHDTCDTFADEPAALIDDSSALGGLTFIESDTEGAAIFAFPAQQHKIAAGDAVDDPATRTKCGKVLRIDDQACRIAIDLTSGAPVPAALLEKPGSFGDTLERSLLRIAHDVVAAGAPAEDALHDVLLRRPPRFTDGRVRRTIQPVHPAAETILPLVKELDDSYLMIQGPPGTGKTQVAAELILALIGNGKRVGLCAPSHAVAHNLLDRIGILAAEAHRRLKVCHKASGAEDRYTPCETATSGFSTIGFKPAYNGSFDLLSGTAWAFAAEDARARFDYIFVDEAGQIELAKFAAMTPAARNMILIGDPAQLAQVSHGSHPGDIGDSVLEYLLQGNHTVPKDRGVLLTTSYRMHHDVCAFVSDLSYQGRLHADPSCNLQSVHSNGLEGSGLRLLPIAHIGNRSASREEAERIAGEIALLLQGDVVDREGKRRHLNRDDIIVVAPYNAQRRLLTRTIAATCGVEIDVGTVNKFQGREAFVVFYSMATSSGDEIPRNLEFLFERNRLNVAVSRARAMAVLVCSPKLLEAATPNIEAMRLINALDRFVERAVVDPGVSKK